MKILKSIFERPYLITLIVFLIAFIEPGKYALYYELLIFLIFLVFISSIVYAIIQKKWQRIIVSIISVFLLGITFSIIMFLKDFSTILSPRKEIGDSKFYSKEIENSIGLKIPKELKILSKLDTIVYMGFEREYDAECLFLGPSDLINELEKQIISQKEFSKVNQLSISQKVKFSDIKSIYKKESDGRFTIYIAFNKNNTKLYYKALYY